MVQTGKAIEAFNEVLQDFGAGKFPKALSYEPGTPAYRSTWQRIIKAAEEANEPGRFTAFIGYEWTSMPTGHNLHRNVIFRDGGDRAGQVEPFTVAKPLGSENPRDLWRWMADYEKKTGGDVLAIAHNGNLSNGIMFPIIEPGTDKEIDLEYCEARARFERLYEATQTKGDSEAYPSLSPNDEFADFETWDKGTLDLSEAKKEEMLEFEYARSAQKERRRQNPKGWQHGGCAARHLDQHDWRHRVDRRNGHGTSSSLREGGSKSGTREEKRASTKTERRG